MKKYTIICVMLLMLGVSSCGYNSIKCREKVSKSYPDAVIKVVPGSNYSFLAKLPDGSIWYIKCNSITNIKITEEFMLFKGDE